MQLSKSCLISSRKLLTEVASLELVLMVDKILVIKQLDVSVFQMYHYRLKGVYTVYRG